MSYQRPHSPLGYDRPLSPTAVSRSVYRRAVPGISDLVRGTTSEVAFDMPTGNSRGSTSIFQPDDGWGTSEQQQQQQQHVQNAPQYDTSTYYPQMLPQQQQQQPYLQQHQQQQQSYGGYAPPPASSYQQRTAHQQPYSIATSVFDEPLHQPFLTARGGVSSVPVSADRRLGDLNAAANLPSLSQAFEARGPTTGGLPLSQFSSSTSAAPQSQVRPFSTTAATTADTTAQADEKLLSAIGNVEKQVNRVQRSLLGVTEQQQAYQMQTTGRQDHILEDTYKNHKSQTTWLAVIAGGLAILLLAVLVTAVYTVMKAKASTKEHTRIEKTIQMTESPAAKRTGNQQATALDSGQASLARQAVAQRVPVADSTASRQQQPMADMSEGIDSDAYASQLRDQRLAAAAK